MQWCVKLGRITIFATDCYDIAEDFKLQYEADADASILEMIKERKQHDNSTKKNNVALEADDITLTAEVITLLVTLYRNKPDMLKIALHVFEQRLQMEEGDTA